MEEKNTLKAKRSPFTAIPNALIGNPNISAKAKAIYCYIYSKPDGWVFFYSDILNHMKEGRDSIRAALTELEKFGYLSRVRRKNEQGKFEGSDYEIFDNPHRENPAVENQCTENPTHSNTDQTKTENKKKNNKKKSDHVSLAEWEAANARLTLITITAWIDENHLDESRVKIAIEQFREKVAGQGKKYADFAAAFKNWLRSGWLGKPFEYYHLPRLLDQTPPPARYIPAAAEIKPTDL